ncbi:hypothetical protein IVB45_02180 [Bradyrhizobium sp. 4]|uniref:hypothetical protein n=1 Tax=Bradyrhizobium sp. 4 TaxID=2782678 RepID=UPI001FFF2160|nr:hypothetical protein [Bradyrhizobium sp. 4]UPJ35842.1 hypothetical protein IVB45_02180 [Bradyrhizobium sp. 4]
MVIALLLAQDKLSKLVAAQTAYAAETHAPLFNDDALGAIRYWAQYYRVSAHQMTETMRCESNFDPTAVGDHGKSFGAAQIYLPAHGPNSGRYVTKEQALDGDFAVRYMASHWKTDTWSCARDLGYYVVR